MANELCECNTGLENTGLPLCEQVLKVVKKVIFVQRASNAGVLTKVDPAATLNKAWMDALLNNSDKSLRWFPTPEIKNVDTPKGDPLMETYEDKSSKFISEDIRKFTGLLPECPPRYKAVLEAVRCNADTYVYLIDKNDNLIGLTNGSDNYLYPMPINAQSIVGKVVLATDKSTTQILLSFEFPPFMQDSKIRMISGDKFTDFSMQGISGLRNVNLAVSSISTTSLTATLTVAVTGLDTPIAVEGLVAADFISSVTGATSKIRNVTDAADIAVATCTETSAGVYVLTYTAQTSADALKLKALLAGYDFSTLPSVAIAIP